MENGSEEKNFAEFRRKVKAAEVLSGSLENLLRAVRFSGRVSVIVQNGKVLKSGYEEGFFRQCTTMAGHEVGGQDRQR